MCVSFSTFFGFLTIFQDQLCVFFIFHVFQFSHHIPGPTVCISHFPHFSMCLAIFQVLQCMLLILHVFQCFLPYSRSYSVHFSFFTFLSDFVIFQVVNWMFLFFHDFQFSCHILSHTVDISKFPSFFSFPRHISRPKVCISHYP